MVSGIYRVGGIAALIADADRLGRASQNLHSRPLLVQLVQLAISDQLLTNIEGHDGLGFNVLARCYCRQYEGESRQSRGGADTSQTVEKIHATDPERKSGPPRCVHEIGSNKSDR